MSKVTKFEDLRCWQLSRILTKRVYVMSTTNALSKDFETRSQFKKAGLSIMNNIAEGFGRFSDKDFIRFLDYSVGSCIEVKSMSYLFLDLDYFSKEEVKSFQLQVEETKASILAFIKYLRSKENKSE
ncbi:MAG: four helix bundle protein [Cytophagales bacterium CG12_big_fil_rev_8_21_14_0_65_40_12]|nr:MAG: four helix bundle protein [Cytophagales bacterium CG12_big_fil_rev_8_21_14_0_65_40_12]PIW04023.1 MAG: four helix bundle protein [Cytophagales bacterium CG17_big_fil_post_rev_8_21_14_2_50_40_13]